MSKVNGDKARQNLHDRKRARMRERMRRLLKPGPAGPARHSQSKKTT